MSEKKNGEMISEITYLEQIVERLGKLEQQEKTLVTVNSAEGGGSSSCQIERTAKGDNKITLKVYSTDLEKVPTVVDMAVDEYKRAEGMIINEKEVKKNDSETKND